MQKWDYKSHLQSWMDIMIAIGTGTIYPKKAPDPLILGLIRYLVLKLLACSYKALSSSVFGEISM
jgi:hypothetical protein